MDNQSAEERTRDNIEQTENAEAGVSDPDANAETAAGLGTAAGGLATGAGGLGPATATGGSAVAPLPGEMTADEREGTQSDYDDTVDDSFPASDPPSSSSTT